MQEKIEIPLSKGKLLFGIGGSIMFVVLGVWLFLNSANVSEEAISFLQEPIFRKIVGILCILFFGAAGFFGLSKLFKTSTGLSIDAQGITDNSNAGSIGLVEWTDIEEVKTEQVVSSKFILIHVSDPEKYIGKAKNKMIAKIMRSNLKMYGTPITINANTLKINSSKLEELVSTKFEEFRSKEL